MFQGLPVGVHKVLAPALLATLEATRLGTLRADSPDALVIGSGAAGGLAALLLAEAGLQVLVLEAGPSLLGSAPDPSRQPIQSQCYAWALAPEAYVDDFSCPYTTPPDRPFIWVRARQIGGRLVLPGHGRQYYRLGPRDLLPPDGLSPPWPFSEEELGPWYAAVEGRLRLAGMRDHIRWLPDSELWRPLEPTPDEAALQHAILTCWPGARAVLGRFAPPFDALEAASATGNLRIRTGAIVREIEVDSAGHVRGAVWIDSEDHQEHRTKAPLVFLCASALESTRLLLLSQSGRSPGGLGAESGALGRYLMDHVQVQALGYAPPLSEMGIPEEGRCLYLPRFDARGRTAAPKGRGFNVQIYRGPNAPEQTYFAATSFAEMVPRPENRVTLDTEQRDAWGIPVLHIDCAFADAELMRARQQMKALRALAELAGAMLTSIDEQPAPPGSANHECGTARMGRDRRDSVLDPFNQCWEAQGLYVTDAACFPSQGAQNPTLTILALTARACGHALRERS